MEYENLISIKKASKLIGISRTQIYRLLEEEILHGVFIGGHRAVRIESVNRYVELKRQLLAIKEEMKTPMKMTEKK